VEYGLKGRGSFLGKEKYVSYFHNFQAGTGAHLPSSLMNTGGDETEWT
jgi:hypothetical protein